MASYRQLKSSGRWNVQVRKSGCKAASATFNTKEQAEQWAINQEDGVHHAQNLSFLELGLMYCDRILTGRSSYEETAGRIQRIAKALPHNVSDITRRDMNEYRLNRLKEVSGVTVRDYIQLVNRVYRFAYREMVLDPDQTPNPCKNLPIPPGSKPRNHVVSKDELALLLSKLSPTMAAIVELAYETAMRRSEIVKLTLRNLHLEERHLTVIDGKTGDRIVPLTTRAVGLLSESSKSCPYPESKLFSVAPHSVSTAVRRARESAGLSSDVRLHQLRHTRITEVAKMGFNQAQIMMVSGHRDVRSVQRYTHLSVKDVIRLLD
jgi:integrase